MKKLMICLDFNEQSEKPYADFLESINTDSLDEIHFVHGVQKLEYGDSFFMNSHGLTLDYDELEVKVIEELKAFSEKVLTDKIKSQVLYKCINSKSPKSDIVNYSIDAGIDNTLIATRGLYGVEGLFSSSFTEYMVRHMNSTLNIIRVVDKR